MLVVFSFPRNAPSALDKQEKIHARDPESFGEDMEVLIWEPWREVLLERSQNYNVDADGVDVDERQADQEARSYIPRPFPLPLSLPRSSQGSQPGAGKPLAGVVLLCDRFVIMK